MLFHPPICIYVLSKDLRLYGHNRTTATSALPLKFMLNVYSQVEIYIRKMCITVHNMTSSCKFYTSFCKITRRSGKFRAKCKFSWRCHHFNTIATFRSRTFCNDVITMGRFFISFWHSYQNGGPLDSFS